jgi:hypothetical protein
LIAAIHQPNYLPWIGYFSKISQSDTFVFLDDVPFSKGGYTNRVRVFGAEEERWLGIPVSVSLGDKISEVFPAKSGWRESHVSSLRNYYSKAEYFHAAWPKVEEVFSKAPKGSISEINIYLIMAIAKELNISCQFIMSSDYDIGEDSGDDRLINLLKQIDPAAIYLSGKGAVNYQNPKKFNQAGLGFRYIEFIHPEYPQTSGRNSPGLSVIDLILNVGWKKAGEIICLREK